MSITLGGIEQPSRGYPVDCALAQTNVHSLIKVEACTRHICASLNRWLLAGVSMAPHVNGGCFTLLSCLRDARWDESLLIDAELNARGSSFFRADIC